MAMNVHGPDVDVGVRSRFGRQEGWCTLDRLIAADWELAATLTQEGRPAVKVPWASVPVGMWARRYLQRAYPEGLYAHQAEALRRLGAGQHVCLGTGTGSGKSAVFYARAIDLLSRAEGARILVLYPMRALASEQEERWASALQEAFPGPEGRLRIARIDGSVPTGDRPRLLRGASVVVATPDVVHAWLLPSVGQKEVRNFLKRLALLVVDEVHQYTGVFGSHAAYLFRRLRHVVRLLDSPDPQFIAASATVAAPERHLHQLFGLPFEVVGPETDGSPRYPMAIHLIRPPREGEPLAQVAKLLQMLAANAECRFIAFVESRKQAELVAAMANRQVQPEVVAGQEGSEATAGLVEMAAAGDDLGLDAKQGESGPEVLGWRGRKGERRPWLGAEGVMSYRAGLEDEDRKMIQAALAQGMLRGVVSTSALEVGIDVPELGIGVLIGVPLARTSLLQRIGRVGRSGPATIFVVHDGGLTDETVFEDPASLFSRPPVETALYLSNPRIQYVHALCLARHGGEHDSALGVASDSSDFHSPVDWPEGFIELCQEERSGALDAYLESMKIEAGESPHLAFPLRDVELQYQVELVRGWHPAEPLGTLTHSQVMREAYPGAIYYYMTRPYRVTQVFSRSRCVRVTPERHYYTQPEASPPALRTDLRRDHVLDGRQIGELLAVETRTQVQEVVRGFKEKRGSQTYRLHYPLTADSDDLGTGLASKVNYRQARFQRFYFTTAVLLLHPDLDSPEVEGDRLATILLETFLFLVPFDRQDVGASAGRLPQPVRWSEHTGQRFIALFDQTYGSLRLSGRLMEDGMLSTVLREAVNLVRRGHLGPLAAPTALALERLAHQTGPVRRWEPPSWRGSAAPGTGLWPAASSAGAQASREARVEVIRPGSRGLGLKVNNQVFVVEKILPAYPGLEGPVYKGRFLTDEGDVVTFVSVRDIVPLLGESELAWYNPLEDVLVGEPGT